MPKKKPQRPAKAPDVLVLVRALWTAGQYRDTRHATQRKDERKIDLHEVRQVIEAGWHEASKDAFKTEWSAWNYAIRGKTVDGRELRIVVSVDEDGALLIITAIGLGS